MRDGDAIDEPHASTILVIDSEDMIDYDIRRFTGLSLMAWLRIFGCSPHGVM